MLDETTIEIIYPEEVTTEAETTTAIFFSDVVNKPFNEMTSTEFNAFHFESALFCFVMALIIFTIGYSKGVFK